MIRIGTCSWTEKTLIKSGEFYPKEARTAEDRLRHYAGVFSTVEVDSVFYAIPDPMTAWLWVERTPEKFVFHVKAYGALTGHAVDARSLPKDIRAELSAEERHKARVSVEQPELVRALAGKLVGALKPLGESGKLGVIVFQFPPWFVYGSRNFDYVLSCKEMMGRLTLAVEFRHGSWLTPDHAASTFKFLNEHKITYVTADEPHTATLATIPFMPRATSDIAYFRFHGRNRAAWFKKGRETAERYNYLYSDEELKEFTGPVIEADKKAAVTYAMFNNCYGSNAVKNASKLEELIGLLKEEGGRKAA
jgi:uncharacterized protein YecE (DUF72 family)